MKRIFTQLAVKVWWHLPLNRPGKERIKTFFFTFFPFLFRRSKTYKNWKYTRSLSQPDFAIHPDQFPPHWPIKKLEAASYRPEDPSNFGKNPASVAVIVHVYYEDVFEEILHYLQQWPAMDVKLYVSCPQSIEDKVESLVRSFGMPWKLKVFENRGRDILPFLRMAPLAQKHDLILKLHTKKSDHRLTGALWRKELFDQLLSAGAIERISALFSHNPSLGMVGASGHIVPMNLYYGANALAIGYFSYCLGVPAWQLAKLNFVAGTMFYIRPRVLQLLLDMHIPDAMFEPEQGQQDGTLAHAIERAFAIACFASGHLLADSRSTPEKLLQHTTRHHPYTW